MTRMVIIPLAFLLCYQPVSSLKCYYCHSYYSWEDCEQHQEPLNCSTGLNTCFTAHRVLTYPRGNQVHEFLRTCFHTESCTLKECKRAEDDRVTGHWCQFECCNTTLCNTVVTPWAERKGYVMMELSSDGRNIVTSARANHWCLLGLLLVLNVIV